MNAVARTSASVEELRAKAIAQYKAAHALMGSSSVPPRSDAEVLELLHTIEGNGGVIPEGTFTTQFLVEFGLAWKAAHDKLIMLEADEEEGNEWSHDALSAAVHKLHDVYPPPGNVNAVDAGLEARAARVLAEANALAISRLEATVCDLMAELLAQRNEAQKTTEAQIQLIAELRAQVTAAEAAGENRAQKSSEAIFALSSRIPYYSSREPYREPYRVMDSSTVTTYHRQWHRL